MVNELYLKAEDEIKQLKEQDFLHGDIFGNGKTYDYQSQKYSQFKSKKNPIAGGKIDLIVTGQFVDAMYLLKPKQSKLKFGNTDKKRNILKEMYGDNIFGLNQVVFDKYQREVIYPRHLRVMKKIINGA